MRSYCFLAEVTFKFGYFIWDIFPNTEQVNKIQELEENITEDKLSRNSRDTLVIRDI